jgi:hypothetical protein
MQQSDLDFVAEHGIHKGVLKNQPDCIDYSYCLEHEGKVLVIGGMKLINSTCAIGWIALTVWAGDHIIEVFRCVKTWLSDMAQTIGLTCVMAFVEAGFEEGERTVEHLGFTLKCRIPNYKGEIPADLYIKTFEVS